MTFADAACDDKLSAAKNPKPMEPVATCMPHCNIGVAHNWDRRGSNGNLRSFRCKVCPFACKEKKVDGRWQTDWVSAPAALQSRAVRLSHLPRVLRHHAEARKQTLTTAEAWC